jgi:PAS domain S-box-containing protein
MSEKRNATADDLDILIDNHPDPMVLADTNGIIWAINSKLAKVLGKPKNEIIGTSGFSLIGKGVVAPRKKAIEEVVRTKKPVTIEDNDMGRWWRTTICPVFDDYGKIVRLATYIQDITSYKVHEERSLEDQQKYYSFLVENSSDVITLIDKDGTIRYQSPSSKRVFGYKPEEMVGKNIFEFTHPDESTELSKEYRKYLKKDRSIMPLERYRVKQKNGNWIYCESIRNNQLDNPLINGIIANTRDVTERVKIEQKLIENEERFRTLSDQSLMGMIIIQDNNIQYLNNAMLAIIGYSREDIIKEGVKILSKIIHPDYYQFSMNQLKKKLEGSEDVETHYPVKIITKDGRHRWLDVFSKTVIYKGRNADFATYVDITDVKYAQDELKNTKEYLQDVINSASDLILVIDNNLKITTWNKTAEIVTGYKSREVIGKTIKKIDLFESIDSILDFFYQEIRGQGYLYYELYLKTKKGSRKILKVTFSRLQSGTKDKKSVLIMGKDITKESDAHGKLVFGNSYMIVDKTNNSAVNLFNNLVTSENNGLFITRDTPETIQSYLPQTNNIKGVVLNQEKLGEFDNVFDLDALTLKIDKFLKTKSKPIILLDRVDYLVTYFSFDAFIKTLYKITNLVIKKKGLLFLRLNPSVISDNQLALIREELKQLPSQTIRDVQLEDYMYDVLGFINEQNQNNTIVTYKKISQKFSISKVTTAKRLDIIKDKGLILIKKQGKAKNIFISEKGKTLLNKKQII